MRIWILSPVGPERHVHIKIIFSKRIDDWQFDSHVYGLVRLQIRHGKFEDSHSWLVISSMAVVLIEEDDLDVAGELSILHNELIEHCSVLFRRQSIIIFIVNVLWMNWNHNLLVPNGVSVVLLGAAGLRVQGHPSISVTSAGVRYLTVDAGQELHVLSQVQGHIIAALQVHHDTIYQLVVRALIYFLLFLDLSFQDVLHLDLDPLLLAQAHKLLSFFLIKLGLSFENRTYISLLAQLIEQSPIIVLLVLCLSIDDGLNRGVEPSHLLQLCLCDGSWQSERCLTLCGRVIVERQAVLELLRPRSTIVPSIE